jgi:hypothetical protein
MAGPDPVFHIGRFELKIVVISDTAFNRTAMSMTIVLTEVHLSDVEVRKLPF